MSNMVDRKDGDTLEDSANDGVRGTDLAALELARSSERVAPTTILHIAQTDAMYARACVVHAPARAADAIGDAAASNCAALLTHGFARTGLWVVVRRTVGWPCLFGVGQGGVAVPPAVWLDALACAMLGSGTRFIEQITQPRIVWSVAKGVEPSSRALWVTLLRYWCGVARGTALPSTSALEACAETPQTRSATKHTQLSLLLPALRLGQAVASRDTGLVSRVVADELAIARNGVGHESLLPMLAFVAKLRSLGFAVGSALGGIDLERLAQLLSRQLEAHLRLPFGWETPIE